MAARSLSIDPPAPAKPLSRLVSESCSNVPKSDTHSQKNGKAKRNVPILSPTKKEKDVVANKSNLFQDSNFLDKLSLPSEWNKSCVELSF